MITTDFNYSRLDHALANILSKRSKGLEKEQQERLYGLVRDVSAALANGHSCIAVSDDDREFLQELACVSFQDKTPLILEQNRLYFYRYWNYEKKLVEQVQRRLCMDFADDQKVVEAVNQHFAEDTPEQMDWQRQAALHVAKQRFSIITGGPGTGKTTTVIRILAILLTLNDFNLRIAMAAPTGKAAMRLQESLLQGKVDPRNHLSEQQLNAIPVEVSTIHRLLGPIRDSIYFKHHADNPLPYDLIVIDEASMIDLSLMSKLFDALKPDARLILLGDKDQLSSVESGAVLADLSLALPQYTSELKKSYRFVGGIKDFARAINQQQSDLSWSLLKNIETTEVRHIEGDLLEHLYQSYKPYWQAVKQKERPVQLFQIFNRYRALCAMRRGLLGVENINASLERKLQQQGRMFMRHGWYSGKPIMITENDPVTGLFNGDIGICLHDPETAELVVYFEKEGGEMKRVLPISIPK